MSGKLTKSQFKSIKSLKQKKFRDENSSFIIEGKKLVLEALNSSVEIEMILLKSEFQLDFSSNRPVYFLSTKELETLSNMKSAPEIMAVCKSFKESVPDFSKTILALDGVADPGNLGTIIRMCDWFGIEQVICQPGTVELYNPKVVQATMGSLFRVKVITMNITDCIAQKPNNMAVYSADMDGRNVYETPLDEPLMLIMGSESHGVCPELIDLSDGVLSIPRLGKAESLNVAVATSILLSEIRRKHFIR